MTTPPKIAKAKIYTKTGDKGTTQLVDGSCVEKFNPRVEAYGTVDELNSYLGVVRVSLIRAPELKKLNALFEKIQNELFNVGSLLACESEEILKKLPPLEQIHIDFLEQKIDEFSIELPELKNFILPAGHECAAHLHFTRTICRRAERRSAEILFATAKNQNTGNDLNSLCLIYLNRLSDFLFVAARWANLKMQEPEVLWKK